MQAAERVGTYEQEFEMNDLAPFAEQGRLIIPDGNEIRMRFDEITRNRGNAVLFRKGATHLAECMIDAMLRRLTQESKDRKKIFNPTVLRPVMIMSAGTIFQQPFFDMLPGCTTGFIAARRDPETFKTTIHYSALGQLFKPDEIVVVGEFLQAAGDTCDVSTEYLIAHGATKIIYLSFLCGPDGPVRLLTKYPQTRIFTAELWPGLNAVAYVTDEDGVPWGDAGDECHARKNSHHG